MFWMDSMKFGEYRLWTREELINCGRLWLWLLALSHLLFDRNQTMADVCTPLIAV